MEEQIICPICHSHNTSFYCKKNNCELSRCGDCDLVFVHPVPSDFGAIYGKQYFKNESGAGDFGYTDYDADKEPMREVFLNYIEKMEGLVSGRRIFDIGAATGYFLNLAKTRGWETEGAEISEYASGIARKNNHKIFCGPFPEAKLEKGFDVVTMWDVLEHLDKPGDYLGAANKILNSGGRLIINTINKKSLWATLMGKRWHLILPPEHLFYYSPKNLKILLSENGFVEIEASKIGKKFSLSYVFQTLYRWQGLKIWKKLSEYFDKPSWRKFFIPINLGDNILIVAQKIKNV